MTLFTDSLTLREARGQFFAANAAVFGPDGGYHARWVRIELGPGLTVFIPNIKARRRAVVLHDLHHIIAGYATDIRSEAEIGAWEIGSGCGGYWVAWLLNLGALGLGLIIAPRRTFRAFIRGCGSDNLYHPYPDEFDDRVLDETVGSLRARLRVTDPPLRVDPDDAVRFAFWSVLGGASLLPLAVPVVALIAAAAWWMWR